MSVRLTVVCDDFSGAEPGFLSSYGFALVAEANDRIVLFDAGTHPKDLTDNLRAHGLHGKDLNAVVLSHNHYDHTDGLPGLLAQNPDLAVYVHEKWDEPYRFKGFAVPLQNRVTIPGGEKVPEWGEGLIVTGTYFSHDYGGIYEQACSIFTESSLVLITGCCHPGLDVFLDELSGNAIGDGRALYIIGGLHGSTFSSERAEAIDQQLHRIYCCHCTEHYNSFKSQFGDKCRRLPVGASLEIP
jgi:7,8-dihydropterin-6-yl-methyl-4-(beta-D-ribofuranosyl)aminobenzene 5'-phosphate synthase